MLSLTFFNSYFVQLTRKNSMGDPETSGQTGNIDGTVRAIKKSTSEKHFLNNGIELASSSNGRNQVMEDAKWHILNLRLFNFNCNLLII